MNHLKDYKMYEWMDTLKHPDFYDDEEYNTLLNDLKSQNSIHPDDIVDITIDAIDLFIRDNSIVETYSCIYKNHNYFTYNSNTGKDKSFSIWSSQYTCQMNRRFKDIYEGNQLSEFHNFIVFSFKDVEFNQLSKIHTTIKNDLSKSYKLIASIYPRTFIARTNRNPFGEAYNKYIDVKPGQLETNYTPSGLLCDIYMNFHNGCFKKGHVTQAREVMFMYWLNQK